MAADPDLIQQAATGSVAAQLGLIDVALAAGANGTCRPIESLVAAETLARLAAANGGSDESRALIGVLLARAEFELSRDAIYNAEWYHGQARGVLQNIADAGDPDAAAVLAQVDDEMPAATTLDGALQAHLRAASQGDLASLTALYDMAAESIIAGQGDLLEALVVAELYARMAAAIGGERHFRRLIAILTARARYEREIGSTPLEQIVTAEAAALMVAAVEGGDRQVLPWLAALVAQPANRGIIAAAVQIPELLNYMPAEGTC